LEGRFKGQIAGMSRRHSSALVCPCDDTLGGAFVKPEWTVDGEGKGRRQEAVGSRQ